MQKLFHGFFNLSGTSSTGCFCTQADNAPFYNRNPNNYRMRIRVSFRREKLLDL